MVPRPTPSALAISATVMSRASYRARARAIWAGESLAGRPPARPRARAAARPTAARSAISSRSNSASAAKMWNTSRPVLVVVSIPSCRDANATPRSASALTVSTRCRSDRPSRSSRHTTSVSPARRYPRHNVSSGRSVSFPDAVSAQVFRQPAAVSASVCPSRFCETPEIRA